MRARGCLAFGGDDEAKEWGQLDIEVAGQVVRTTIGPVGAAGVTIESDDRRVWHHHLRVERARKAAEYRSRSVTPIWKPEKIEIPDYDPRQDVVCPECAGAEPDCARCGGDGLVRAGG